MVEDNTKEHVVVQTYAEDMAEVIGSNKEGLMKKIIKGEEENERQKIKMSPEAKLNRFFITAGSILIILGFGTAAYFVITRKTPTAVPILAQFTPLVFNDQTAFIEVKNLTRDEIIQSVRNEIASSKVKQGGVEGIYLTENTQVIGLRRFLALTLSNFAPGDNKILVEDNFMMGIVNNSTDLSPLTGKDFFILIKMNSVADIFQSLRLWESKMFTDLNGLLGVDISSDTKYLLTKDFTDGIIENKNARILYGQDGKMVLGYIFANDNSVIVTGSPAAAHEVMSRLTSSKVKQ